MIFVTFNASVLIEYFNGEKIMAANIHYRTLEEDFEVAEKIKPLKVDLSAVRLKDKSASRGLFKLSLSVTYFFVLVYFLVKLLV